MENDTERKRFYLVRSASASEALPPETDVFYVCFSYPKWGSRRRRIFEQLCVSVWVFLRHSGSASDTSLTVAFLCTRRDAAEALPLPLAVMVKSRTAVVGARTDRRRHKSHRARVILRRARAVLKTVAAVIQSHTADFGSHTGRIRTLSDRVLIIINRARVVLAPNAVAR